MNIYVQLIGTVILLALSANAFYVTFKKYEDDDDYTLGVSTLEFYEIILGAIEFISSRLFPKRYHIVISKIISFIFGLIMLGFSILLWLI
ncbi:hypothetical protein ACFVR2_06600 [Gottfriedia sp. NPDC057991]|uniref:hypothetical protein n=1 Tax=Gottfriedia sp. NPDC057991 TaxID=3346298 RepID=UPI0036D93C8F